VASQGEINNSKALVSKGDTKVSVMPETSCIWAAVLNSRAHSISNQL